VPVGATTTAAAHALGSGAGQSLDRQSTGGQAPESQPTDRRPPEIQPTYRRSPTADAPPRAPLDRQRILNAALELVDRDGLEALSMRKLGAALGVEAMALYYHVPNKAALLEGLAELVLAQLPVPEPPYGDWTDVIRGSARAFRDLGIQHPNVFPLLATVGFSNPASLRPAEAVLDVLCNAGLDLSAAFVAFVSLKSYVVGHTVWALGGEYDPDRFGQICDTVPHVSEAEYPRLAAFAQEIEQHQVDAEFERGLELFIDGVRTRLANATPDQ
jgi:AcrR family transcriptional regulator